MDLLRVPDPRIPVTVSTSALATPGFELRVARALALLCTANLRLSVFAVGFRDLDAQALRARLQTALSRSHEVDCLDGDRVGILYYGPRPQGAGSDRRIEADLHARLVAALGGPARNALSLQALHVSSADIFDAEDLIRELRREPCLPPRPALTPRPLAA